MLEDCDFNRTSGTFETIIPKQSSHPRPLPSTLLPYLIDCDKEQHETPVLR